MLRQTLRSFVNTLALKFTTDDLKAAKKYLKNNEFHKRLRDEITMIPIPKLKLSKKMLVTGMAFNKLKNLAIEEQKHILEWAIDRVSINFILKICC